MFFEILNGIMATSCCHLIQIESFAYFLKIVHSKSWTNYEMNTCREILASYKKGTYAFTQEKYLGTLLPITKLGEWFSTLQRLCLLIYFYKDTSSRTWTYNSRFWKPVFYQLNYRRLQIKFLGKLNISGWQDLNLRPLDPKSSALPNCATSRLYIDCIKF